MREEVREEEVAAPNSAAALVARVDSTICENFSWVLSGGRGTGSDSSFFMSVRGIRVPDTEAMATSTVSFRRNRLARKSRATPARGRRGINSVEHFPENEGVATLFR